ncbi:MAG: 6-phosphogluconolactonase [Marmoricola sp.]
MRSLHISPDAAGVARTVAQEMLARLARIQHGGRDPHLVLTGGTIADKIHQEVARLSPESAVDWTRVVVWWGDERFVAPDSEDRNALHARRDLLDVVGATQVHEMPSTANASSIDEAARMYAATLREHGPERFDLLMLGLGKNGHVASLMPHKPTLDVTDASVVGVPDSPKPPPTRVSMTFPRLNRSDALWFVVSGEDKADAVARATAPEGDVHETPARGLTVADTVWYVDEAAASLA